VKVEDEFKKQLEEQERIERLAKEMDGKETQKEAAKESGPTTEVKTE
jgi:hypothetical protein